MKTEIFLFTLICLFGNYKHSTGQVSFSDINHIVHMGQSLGAGEQSLPVVTGEDSGYGNLMFAMGTHTWSNRYYADVPEQRESKHFTFVPLKAQQRGQEGETIANGMCDHLSQSIGIKKRSHQKPRFLFSYAGQGGRYLRELDKRHDDAKDPRSGSRRSNGGYYRTSIDDVRRAKSTADSLGLSYQVLAVTWMQGESNGAGGVNRWDAPLDRQEFLRIYQEDLIALKNDYQDDITTITEQEYRPAFFSYQTAGRMSGIAQLRACNEESDMYMVGPTYMLPNAENSYYEVGGQMRTGDGIHLTADGSRWLGEQFGKVIRRVLVEGEDWQPLQPLRAKYSTANNEVEINFHVPVEPLVIDTLFLPAQGKGLGFYVYDQHGKNYEINKVSVTGKTVVKLDLKTVPNNDKQLYIRYGQESFVRDVSTPIHNIQYEDGEQGRQVKLKFKGNLLQELSLLMEEGVFYLENRAPHDSLLTNIIIRKVEVDGQGNTVLSGLVKDLRKEINFREGQHCYIKRRYTYGNLRDQDAETSIYSFSDGSYGMRQGKKYPLWNWCVGFMDFPVSM